MNDLRFMLLGRTEVDESERLRRCSREGEHVNEPRLEEEFERERR